MGAGVMKSIHCSWPGGPSQWKLINMLSWSTESLLADGRSQGEIRQGVTTEIMGEGWSMGPLNDRIKRRMKAEQTDIDNKQWPFYSN